MSTEVSLPEGRVTQVTMGGPPGPASPDTIISTANAVATAADALQTAADAATTEANVVLTNADAATTTANASSSSTSAAAAALAGGIHPDEATGNAAVADGDIFAAVGAASESSVDIWQRVSVGVSTLLNSYPNLVWLNSVLQRLSPLKVDLAIGSALYNLRGVNLIGATYTTEYYIKYFHRNGSNQFQCYIVRTSDDVTMATVGASGSAIDVTGYTGVIEIPLIEANSSGITGSVSINFGTGATFNSGQSAFAATDSALDNSKIMVSDEAKENTKALALEVFKDQPNKSPWLKDVTDLYTNNFVRNVAVERGVPGRQYGIRYRHDTVGSSRRFTVYLYDFELDDDIAWWSKSKDYDHASELPDVIALSGIAGGSPITGSPITWTGTSATVWIDKNAIDFNNRVTDSETSSSLIGIKKDRVQSREETNWRIRTGNAISKTMITVGPDGSVYDFTSLKAATDSLLMSTSLARSAFPFSEFVSPSNQYHILVAADHEEEWVEHEVDQGGGLIIGQGILLYEGLTIEFSEKCIFYTTGSVTYGGPLYEASYGGRLLGPVSAKLQQRGDNGYIGHIDRQNLVDKSALLGPPEQYSQLVFECNGLEHEATLATHNSPLVGCGISDGQDVTFMRGKMTRNAASTTGSPFFFAHTSGSSIRPGKNLFDRMKFNEDVVPSSLAISFAKRNGGLDDAQTVRHELEVINSKISQISADDKWISVGSLSGATVTPSGVLD